MRHHHTQQRPGPHQPARLRLAGRADKPESLNGPLQKIEPNDLKTVRCHLCYSPQVSAICHHCGRFLCAKCRARPSIWLSPLDWLFADNTFAHLKPLPAPKLRQAAHCPACYHRDFQPAALFKLAGWLLILLALINVSLGGDWFWSELSIIGAVISALVAWLITHFFPLKVNYVPAFPLFCQTTIEFKEKITADFNITGTDYLMHDEVATGAIQVKLDLKPGDRERYQNARFRKPSPNGLITLHAGFVGLEALKHIRKLRRFKTNLFLLTTRIPFARFADICNHSKELELAEEPYQVPLKQALQFDPPHHKEFPFLIRPRLVKGGNCLEIKLEIVDKPKLVYPNHQLEDKDDPAKELEGKPILEWLELQIPAGWEIVDTDGQVDNTETLKIIWRKKVLDVNTPTTIFVEFQPEKNFLQPQAIDYHSQTNGTEAVQIFESPPNSTQPPHDQASRRHVPLIGTYEVTIENWTISQLHAAQESHPYKGQVVYPANGLRISHEDEDLKWLKPTLKYTTTITGRLCIDPSYLSSQQIQAVSHLLIGTEAPVEVKSQEQLPVAPSYHIVNEVVDALTGQQVFIKQVRESAGYPIENKIGGRQVRYWEIRGKYYPNNGLQSVALHLVITGEEPRTNQPNCQGSLSFELSLRNYTETEDYHHTLPDLKEKHALFQQVIRRAIYQGRQIDYAGHRLPAWQHEQREEQQLKQRLGTDQVALILTPNGHARHGHLFYVPNGDEILQDIDGISSWYVHSKQQLPHSDNAEFEWVDKWELLREIKEEPHNGKNTSM